MTIRVYFGKRLKEIREMKNLTQAQLGELIGLQPQTISQIERGRRAVSFTMLETIIKALDIDPSDLFIFEKEQKAPALIKTITKELSDLDEDSLRYILGMIKKFKEYKNP